MTATAKRKSNTTPATIRTGTGSRPKARRSYDWGKLVKVGDYIDVIDPALERTVRSQASKIQKRRGITLTTSRLVRGVRVTLMSLKPPSMIS